MNFRNGLATAALATGLAIAVLTGCNNASSAPPVSPTPTLEATVQATATPTGKPEEKQGKLSWQGNYRELSYKNDGISWKTSIAEGVEETVMSETGLLRTASDFKIQGALEDLNYGLVVGWGKVQDAPFSKISIRDSASGAEIYHKWLKGDFINCLQLVSYGGADYLVIGGYTGTFINQTNQRVGYAVKEVPLVMALRIAPGQETIVSYSPLALVEGHVKDMNPVTGVNGTVNLKTTVITYDPLGRSNESIVDLPLDDLFSIEKGKPILPP